MMCQDLKESVSTPGQEPSPHFALCPFNTDPGEQEPGQTRAPALPCKRRQVWGHIGDTLIVLLFLVNSVLFALDHFVYLAWLHGSFPVRSYHTITLITNGGDATVEASSTQRQVSFEARKYVGSSCGFPAVSFYLTDNTITIIIDPAGSRGCVFDLTVPDRTDVHIQTDGGSLDVNN